MYGFLYDQSTLGQGPAARPSASAWAWLPALLILGVGGAIFWLTASGAGVRK